MSISQSIIMPYHRNKAMLQYTTAQLEKFVDSDVEIVVLIVLRARPCLAAGDQSQRYHNCQ